jgi:ResB-like family
LFQIRDAIDAGSAGHEACSGSRAEIIVTENSSASAARAQERPRSTSIGSEGSKIVLLVAAAMVTGGVLQFFVEPGPKALVAAGSIAGLTTFALSRVLPGRWRETMAGFRFTSVLLIALGLCAILGTLILQGRPLHEYPLQYGLVGDLIVAARLDDIFHSLWFGCLIALFFAAVLNSALLRWPPRLRNLGFFTCHVGLLTSLLGAALSCYFAVHGRVEMFADGSTVNQVFVTRNGQLQVKGYDAAGNVIPATAPLGFDLRLDQFDLVRYATEYRVAYYEPRMRAGGRVDWRLLASFDPEPGVKHLLPGGNSFTLSELWTDYRPGDESANLARGRDASAKEMKNPAAVLQVRAEGVVSTSKPLVALGDQNYLAVPPESREPRGILTFERREEEAKSYRSHVTATAGTESTKALVSVNEPFTFKGWTFYQANFDPKNPKYSGLQAVHDPGVNFVFGGFALIVAGVVYMFYFETRLRRRRSAEAEVEIKAAA